VFFVVVFYWVSMYTHLVLIHYRLGLSSHRIWHLLSGISLCYFCSITGFVFINFLIMYVLNHICCQVISLVQMITVLHSIFESTATNFSNFSPNSDQIPKICHRLSERKLRLYSEIYLVRLYPIILLILTFH
jgi:hypothetical protein